MLKKKFVIILFGTFLMLSICPSAQAVVFGTPTVYQVTVNRIEISKDSCATWVAVGSGSLTFDIASANVGAVVGNYCTNNNIEAGTYNKMRATVSRTFTVRGSIRQDTGQNNGNLMYTSAAGATNVAANLGSQSVTCPTAGLPSGISLSPDGDFYCSQDVNLVINNTTASQNFTINFNVTNCLALYPDDTFFPQPPSVTVSVQ